MTPSELAMYDSYATSGNKYFVPAVWAASLVYRARRDGRVKFDIACNHIIKVHTRTVTVNNTLLRTRLLSVFPILGADAKVSK